MTEKEILDSLVEIVLDDSCRVYLDESVKEIVT